MSRLFTDIDANSLSHDSFDPPLDINLFTHGLWVKAAPIGLSSTFTGLGNSGSSLSQQSISISAANGLRVYTNSAYLNGSAIVDEWTHLVHRRRAQSGGYVHEFFINGVEVAASGVIAADVGGSALLTNRADLRIGQSNSGGATSEARIAHVFTVFRDLSNAEISLLAGGGNPDSLANLSGRREYYPLTGSSLVNVWADELAENPPYLTMNGTVAVDAASNPTVDAAATPSTVSVNSGIITPGSAIIGIYSGYAVSPTVLELTDSNGNALTPAVTIDDTAKTFSATYPARITTGTGTTLLRGPVTLELT